MFDIEARDHAQQNLATIRVRRMYAAQKKHPHAWLYISYANAADVMPIATDREGAQALCSDHPGSIWAPLLNSCTMHLVGT